MKPASSRSAKNGSGGQPLHGAMRTHGVATEIYLDIRDQAPRGSDPAAHARSYVDAFLGKSWPFGTPFPTLFYDPRSAESRAVASPHAKCIVVDLLRALVTSANFTDRGQTRNVELGVLVEDRDFASQVAAQWRLLAEADVLVPIVPGT